MRMKELHIDGNGRLIIDTIGLSGPCAIVISEGKAKVADLPFHADVKITTYKGKVTRVNWDEGGIVLTVSDWIQLFLASMAAIGSIFAFWNISVSKQSIELQRKQWEHSLVPIYRILHIKEFSHQDTTFVLENTNHVAHQIERIGFSINDIGITFSFHGSIENRQTRGNVTIRESEHSGFLITLKAKTDGYICGYLQIQGKDSLGNEYKLNTNLIEFENYKLKNHLILSKSYLNRI